MTRRQTARRTYTCIGTVGRGRWPFILGHLSLKYYGKAERGGDLNGAMGGGECMGENGLYDVGGRGRRSGGVEWRRAARYETRGSDGERGGIGWGREGGGVVVRGARGRLDVAPGGLAPHPLDKVSLSKSAFCNPWNSRRCTRRLWGRRSAASLPGGQPILF